MFRNTSISSGQHARVKIFFLFFPAEDALQRCQTFFLPMHQGEIMLYDGIRQLFAVGFSMKIIFFSVDSAPTLLL